MIPKIEFRYSYIYDKIYRDSCNVKDFLDDVNKEYPSKKNILEFVSEIKNAWKINGTILLKKISKIFGLKWSEKKIVCYVVGFSRPMSDPLTIKFCKDVNHAIDVLTHELIHRMQSGLNDKKWRKWLSYLDSKYPKESRTAKDHVLLNAVHKKIYFDLFDNRRFERDVENSRASKSYKRSWEIVDELGHEEIIKKFREI